MRASTPTNNAGFDETASLIWEGSWESPTTGCGEVVLWCLELVVLVVLPGSEVGVEVGAEEGAEVGADDGAEVGTDVGAEVGVLSEGAGPK